MNLFILIIGLVLIGWFIINTIIYSGGWNRNRKLLLKKLRSDAKKNEITISEYDIWDKSSIGINDVKNKIIYIDSAGQEMVTTIFSLNDVKTFSTIPDTTNKIGKYIDLNIETGLILNFTFKDPSEKILSIYIHREESGIIRDIDKERFLKWTRIIGQAMKLK